MQKPLAERMRPKSLTAYIGQKQLVAKGKPIYEMVHKKQLRSMILWGPPGVGKTTLAKIIAKESSQQFFALNAIDSGVKEVRKVIEVSKKLNGAVLFIDEIHRFNKAQQDALLSAVEQGIITLIGATTENPSFEVISPLLSRAHVYVLEALSKQDLEEILNQAIQQDEVLKTYQIELVETERLLQLSGGDARKLYNLLELIVDQAQEKTIQITNEFIQSVSGQLMARYDKSGEQHYDLISAMIKSIRGSDPNASLYWLARMIVGGEDIKFIARRLIISASEDIGNANPNALLLANTCFEAVSKIGYPEGRILLGQTVVYLANSPKSNSTYTAIDEAIAFVKKTGDLPVPMHLRNAPTKLMDELGYGKEYLYAHAFENNFIMQEYFPEEITSTQFYQAGNNPSEQKQAERLRHLWKEKYEY